MTPSQLVDKLLSLGVCYQGKPGANGSNSLLSMFGLTPEEPQQEDFSKLGYNADKDNDKENETSIDNKTVEVLSEKEELLKFNLWYLAINPPKDKINISVQGHVLYCYIDKKRQFVVRGDDVPFVSQAIEHKFLCEYIKDIELNNGKILLVHTEFGQTGIVLPLHGI